MTAPCDHLEDLPLDPMPEGGCEECLRTGDTWVHLRYCVACGHTGCCDASKNKHATKHARAEDHPVIRSKEPGEFWAYCYVDDEAIRTDTGGSMV